MRRHSPGEDTAPPGSCVGRLDSLKTPRYTGHAPGNMSLRSSIRLNETNPCDKFFSAPHQSVGFTKTHWRWSCEEAGGGGFDAAGLLRENDATTEPERA